MMGAESRLNMSVTNHFNTDSVKNRIRTALEKGIAEVASARTKRYVIDQKDYSTRLDDVANTLVGLMSSFGSSVSVDGDVYNVSEYKVPNKLIDLLNVGRVYGSCDAIERVEPMFEIVKEPITLTPGAFNAFFINFNAQQGDCAQFSLSEGYVRRDVTLEDVQYLEDACGSMRKFHNQGLPIEICSIVGLRIEAIEDYLLSYSKPSDRAIGLWLLQ